jgi:hypothetical protein
VIGHLGSHWRWRLPLLAAALIVFACAWSITRERAIWSFLPGGTGSTALLVADKGWCKTVVAWEPSTGKRWTVVPQCSPYHFVDSSFANIVVARGGRAVCWEEKGKLHVVDVAPPHEHQVWELPTPLEQMGDQRAICGLSSDERFAVFMEPMRSATPGAMPTYHVSVVNLQHKINVGMRVFSGLLHPSYLAEGDFEAYTAYSPNAPENPEEPFAARWRLTDAGEWELIEDLTPNPLFPLKYVAFTEREDGSFRRLAAGEKVSAANKQITVRLLATSPDFKRASAPGPTVNGESLYLLSESSDDVLRMAMPHGVNNNGNMLRDGSAFVGVNDQGDVQTFDPTTGRETARLAIGTAHRQKLVPIITALLIVMLLWLFFLARERTLAWGLFDTLPPPILLAWVLPLTLMLFRFNNPRITTNFDAILEFGLILATIALMVGVAMTVAWFWAYGRGPMLLRWLAGLALLAVAAMPTGGFASSELRQIAPINKWYPIFAGGVIAATLGALLVSTGRARGWVLSDTPISQDPRRYNLAHFLTMLVGLSFAFAMGRVLAAELQFGVWIALVALLGEAFFVGTALGSAMYLRKPWHVIAWTVATITILIAFSAWFSWMLNIGPFTIYLAVLHVPAWLAVAIPVVLPNWVARRHGWRWERVANAEAATRAVAAFEGAS